MIIIYDAPANLVSVDDNDSVSALLKWVPNKQLKWVPCPRLSEIDRWTSGGYVFKGHGSLLTDKDIELATEAKLEHELTSRAEVCAAIPAPHAAWHAPTIAPVAVPTASDPSLRWVEAHDMPVYVDPDTE